MQNWVPTRWLPTLWILSGEWRAHPVRMGLAVLAIAVGVALGFAVHMVNSAALASFGRAVASVQGRADVAVRARSAAGLDEALYPKLARLPQVQAISPVVELSASWGKLARPGSQAKGGRFTLIGLDPLRAMSVTPGLVGLSRAGQSGVGSRPAWQGDAVWLSPALQRATGLQPGDAFTLTAAGRQAQFTVMGQLAAAGDEAQIAVIDISEAQWRFGQMGRLHRLDLKLADGAGARAAVQAALPADAVLATPEAEASRADALSRAYRVNLGMLALVALLTGGFLVWSAQALSVARRRPQFALLAVLGLPRAGLVRQLLSEGLLLGVAGAALGVALGYGLATLVVEQFGGDLGGGYFSRTQARLGFDVLAALLFGGLGLVTALAGSLAPALAAARTAPAQALKGLGGQVAGIHPHEPELPGPLAAGREQLQHGAGDRALATARRAHQGNAFARLQLQIEAVEGGCARPGVAHLQSPEAQHRGGWGRGHARGCGAPAEESTSTLPLQGSVR